MEKRSTVLFSGIKFGFLTALMMLVFSVFLQITGLAKVVSLNWFFYVIFIVGIIMGHYSYKENGDGYMTYGQGLGIGAIISLIIGLAYGAFIFIYVKYIDRTILDNMVSQVSIILEQQNYSDEQIDDFTEMAERLITPEAMFVTASIGWFIIGLLFSLVTAAITKKTNPEDDI